MAVSFRLEFQNFKVEVDVQHKNASNCQYHGFNDRTTKRAKAAISMLMTDVGESPMQTVYVDDKFMIFATDFEYTIGNQHPKKVISRVANITIAITQPQ